VEAGAGENWHALVRWTLDRGWPGLENLSLIPGTVGLIPGTVGAAPIQNIGAYGLEIVDRFDSLDAVSLDDGRTRCFTRADCRFGYRDSVFKHAEASRWLITRVRLRLPRRWQPLTRYADVAAELAARELSTPTAVQISDVIATIRRRKLPDPALIGNAGSFFKNPVVDAATWSSTPPPCHTCWPTIRTSLTIRKRTARPSSRRVGSSTVAAGKADAWGRWDASSARRWCW